MLSFIHSFSLNVLWCHFNFSLKMISFQFNFVQFRHQKVPKQRSQRNCLTNSRGRGTVFQEICCRNVVGMAYGAYTITHPLLLQCKREASWPQGLTYGYLTTLQFTSGCVAAWQISWSDGLMMAWCDIRYSTYVYAMRTDGKSFSCSGSEQQHGELQC